MSSVAFNFGMRVGGKAPHLAEFWLAQDFLQLSQSPQRLFLFLLDQTDDLSVCAPLLVAHRNTDPLHLLIRQMELHFVFGTAQVDGLQTSREFTLHVLCGLALGCAFKLILGTKCLKTSQKSRLNSASSCQNNEIRRIYWGLTGGVPNKPQHHDISKNGPRAL